jgi:hypothetical protein
MHLWSQYLARKIAQKLILQHEINIIHQPTPVSPKHISLHYNLGIPIVIGPLNGGMSYPPAFAKRSDPFSKLFLKLGRQTSDLFHQLIPGKLEAEMILVANQRTYESLPKHVKGKVEILCENGIDTEVWQNFSPRNFQKKKSATYLCRTACKMEGS